jgi:hypothetical protein
MRNDSPMTTSKRTTFTLRSQMEQFNDVYLWNLNMSMYANVVSPWTMAAMTVVVHFVTTDARILNINTDSCTCRLMTLAAIRLTRKNIKINEVGQLHPRCAGQSLTSTVHTNTTHKLYTLVFIFHYMFRPYVLTIIRWNSRTA